MIDSAIIQKIKELSNSDFSSTEISRLLNNSYPTVRKYSGEEKDYKNAFAQETRLSTASSQLVLPFSDDIGSYFKSGATSIRKLELTLKKKGYAGSYQTLNNYCKKIKTESVIRKTNAYFRVETSPGEQAQIDWGYFGKVSVNGEKVRLYAFVFILSYSRTLYAEFVLSQKQKTLQDCHINAFHYVGGIPQKIRYDNMKTVVINRQKSGGEHIPIWNFEFKNFARYFKFQPELCPRYYPRSKGKVEAAVKFIRNHFFHGEAFGKTFNGISELNIKLREWLDNYANHRKVPNRDIHVQELWEEEKKHLEPISKFHSGSAARNFGLWGLRLGLEISRIFLVLRLAPRLRNCAPRLESEF